MPNENEYKNWIRFESLSREYQVLKSEQSARIGFRDNLLYVTLASMGALLGFSLFDNSLDSKDSERALCLLAGPWISIILGWTYSINDRAITRIARYTENQLKKHFERLEGLDSFSVLEWETIHRSYKGRFARKLIQISIDLFAFPFAGAFFLVLAIQKSKMDFGNFGLCLIILEVILLILVAGHIILNSGLNSD
ncbi:hypothetical protein [Gimesia aquarii]|uniref:Uncharacterized protein n=1 Tax=Gimesia aquarii TaxID=2527964 RepID=A0A517X3M2_9PLAN|nr:hypothetical protein [Gimesia aquarii]QDU12111.1 hypothetical protein V202x_55360 [Gimesia aquarii]